jgi:hypothetical protein
MIQPYLDDLQDRFGLKRIKISDLGDTGGSFSTNEDDITKWWFAFWESQPSFWFRCKKSNGQGYGTDTLERYMGSLKNQLVKKFVMSRYLKVIEEAYNSARTTMKAMVKEQKKTSPSPPKNKVYSTRDIAFILERCLWFNLEKFIDFFVFQTATLRLSSRAAETSRLSIENLSIREHYEPFPNEILQCYLVRDKNGVDAHHPVIPNKDGLFGDLAVAIGLALFIRCDNNNNYLMPSIATLSPESAVSSYYATTLNVLWRRYPPAPNEPVRKGTSHFGKHTAQFQLDGCRLHIAAQLFGGWNIGEGARSDYFSNPFPYLLDGAKALAYWPKISGEYQAVRVPPLDVVSKDIGDKICSAFFGHISEDVLGAQVKHLLLVCVLVKWDKLVEHIRAEPNGLFRDPSNHIIFSTLEKRLSAVNVGLDEFENFKSVCEDLFKKTNNVHPPVHSPKKAPKTAVIYAPEATNIAVTPPPSEARPLEDPELNVHRLAGLLDLITRNTSPQTDLVNFFTTCNFIDVYRSIPRVPTRMQEKYRKIKSAVRVMVRFLDNYPTHNLTIEEANSAVARIKSVLISEAPRVKHQGSKPFTIATPVCLSIIRANESLLTDKTKPWYRKLPRNTPHVFFEHMYPHKIYDIE